MTHRADHPGPPPNPALMRMQWRNLLFIHWPISIDDLRPLIPQSLEIDHFDGQAWIALVPFSMRDVLPRQVPDALGGLGLGDIPAISAFPECNVRTYVYPRGDRSAPGVWFFSLDAASRPAVWAARKFFKLPYFHSRMMQDRRDDLVRYSVDRIDSPQAAMRCAWRVGDPLPQTKPGELAHFLTERLALYTVDANGDLFRCRIAHRPWPLRSAALISLEDELVRAAGITLDQSHEPLLHHADALDVEAWKLERVNRSSCDG